MTPDAAAGGTDGLVSTIIPVRNRPRLVREAVESVLAQTYRPIEVLVVDDGSTDGTPDVLAALGSEAPGVVRTLRTEGVGVGPAREAARRLARGDFIQYLDSDDLLLPRKFEVQVAALRESPECGVAYGRSRLESLEGEVLADPYKWTGRKLDSLFPGLLIDRWWCTHTPLYRREVSDAVGPWSDLRYSQDWEYDGRVGALGTRLAWCDVDVSVHRAHGGARQTGHGGWLEPPEAARFFRSLLESAERAGVPPSDPARRHFARWAFAEARRVGAEGDAEAARELIRISVEAAGEEPTDVRLYRRLSSVVGWRTLGRLARLAERLRGGGSGPETRPLSWAGAS